MNNPLNELTNNLNTSGMNVWWSLPSSVQDQVKKLVPNKNTWSLNCKKVSDTGDWVFSLPQFLTFNESLTGGTEKVIDFYYEQEGGKPSKKGSTCTLTVSSEKPKPGEKVSCVLQYLTYDPLWLDSTYYQDTENGMVSWLCPYLQVLFKGTPDYLYVVVKPT